MIGIQFDWVRLTMPGFTLNSSRQMTRICRPQNIFKNWKMKIRHLKVMVSRCMHKLCGIIQVLLERIHETKQTSGR